MKTACAYIRVSTSMQTEYSPDAQKRLITDYCKQNDYILSDFFEDIGISGTKSDNRPEFNRMIAECKDKSHPYDAVIVWKFSRFARNQEESIVYKRLLKKCDVEVISISEPLPEGFVGELVERIFEWMDEYYSINLSNEVKRGMTQKAMKGEYQGRLPLGYVRNPITKKIEIEPREAEVVRYIFDAFTSGMTLNALTRDLNAKQIHGRSKLWNRSSVEYILRNPFYIGKLRWNYKTANEVKPASEWVLADSNNEHILSDEVFNKAQELLPEIIPYVRKKQASAVSCLSGLIKCVYCGKPIYYRKDKLYPHYRCQGTVAGVCKNSQYTKAAVFEAQFLEGLQYCLDNKLYTTTAKTITTLPVDYDKQLKALEAKEKRIKDAYMNGIDTLEEYKENKARILSEREKIEHSKANSNATIGDDKSEVVANLIDMLKSDAIEVSKKNEALKRIIDYVVYDKANQRMDFYFL